LGKTFKQAFSTEVTSIIPEEDFVNPLEIEKRRAWKVVRLFNNELKGVCPKIFYASGFSQETFDLFSESHLAATRELLCMLDDASLNWFVDDHQKRALTRL